MAYERIDLDPHARDRQRGRLISERQIAATVQRPDRVYPGHTPGRLVAERDTEAGNTLRVVYVEQDDGRTAYVITAIRMRRRGP